MSMFIGMNPYIFFHTKKCLYIYSNVYYLNIYLLAYDLTFQLYYKQVRNYEINKWSMLLQNMYKYSVIDKYK